MIAHDYLGVVLAGMRTTRLLASGGGGDGLDGTLQEVAKLKGFNEVTEEPDEYLTESYWLPGLTSSRSCSCP